MEELIKLMEGFEQRNNLSIDVVIHSDGSCLVREFWDEEELIGCDTVEDLRTFLSTTEYELDTDGLCPKKPTKKQWQD